MELSQLPADDIVAVYRRVWSEAERHWGVTILAGYLGLAVYAASTLLVQRWTEIAEVNLAALLPGGPPNRTLESVHSTVALAEQINAIPGLSERVLTADAGETWEQIEARWLRQQVGRRCHYAPSEIRRSRDERPQDRGTYAAPKTRNAH